MSSDQQPPTVQALVDALDQRARQAGTEGASTVLRGLVANLSDTLAGVEARLAALEASLAEGATSAELEQLRSNVATVSSRLGRLEEAFIQAVDDSGSGTQAIVAEVTAAVRQALTEAGPAPADPALQAAIEGLHVLIDSLPDPARSVTAVAQAVAEVAARLDGLTATVDALATAPSPDVEAIVRRVVREREPFPDVEAIVRGVVGEREPFPDVEAIVRRVLSDQDTAADATLHRLAADVEALARHEQEARLIGMVEDRIGAGLNAAESHVRAAGARADELAARIDRMADDTSAALGQLAAQVEEQRPTLGRLSAGVDELAARLAGVTSQLGDVVAHLTAAAGTLDELSNAMSAAEARLEVAPTEAAVSAAIDAGYDRAKAELSEVVQRVAALAVGLDGVRRTLDEHVAETANTLSRRATEAGRRLAADLGRRNRGRDRDRDPDRGRQLGPGSH